MERCHALWPVLSLSRMRRMTSARVTSREQTINYMAMLGAGQSLVSVLINKLYHFNTIEFTK